MEAKKTLIGRPNFEQAPVYAHYFFQLTKLEDDLEVALIKNRDSFAAFIQSIPADKVDFRYADDKWTVKGVITHCIETERVLQYRALRFSRKDTTPLEGFDENWYVEHNNHDQSSLTDLAEEFVIVRKATLTLLQRMTTPMLDFVGTANGSPNTARNVAWFILGHNIHHEGIIKQRYLVDTDEWF